MQFFYIIPFFINFLIYFFINIFINIFISILINFLVNIYKDIIIKKQTLNIVIRIGILSFSFILISHYYFTPHTFKIIITFNNFNKKTAISGYKTLFILLKNSLVFVWNLVNCCKYNYSPYTCDNCGNHI